MWTEEGTKWLVRFGVRTQDYHEVAAEQFAKVIRLQCEDDLVAALLPWTDVADEEGAIRIDEIGDIEHAIDDALEAL